MLSATFYSCDQNVCLQWGLQEGTEPKKNYYSIILFEIIFFYDPARISKQTRRINKYWTRYYRNIIIKKNLFIAWDLNNFKKCMFSPSIAKIKRKVCTSPMKMEILPSNTEFFNTTISLFKSGDFIIIVTKRIVFNIIIIK